MHRGHAPNPGSPHSPTPATASTLHATHTAAVAATLPGCSAATSAYHTPASSLGGDEQLGLSGLPGAGVIRPAGSTRMPCFSVSARAPPPHSAVSDGALSHGQEWHLPCAHSCQQSQEPRRHSTRMPLPSTRTDAEDFAAAAGSQVRGGENMSTSHPAASTTEGASVSGWIPGTRQAASNSSGRKLREGARKGSSASKEARSRRNASSKSSSGRSSGGCERQCDTDTMAWTDVHSAASTRPTPLSSFQEASSTRAHFPVHAVEGPAGGGPSEHTSGQWIAAGRSGMQQEAVALQDPPQHTVGGPACTSTCAASSTAGCEGPACASKDDDRSLHAEMAPSSRVNSRTARKAKIVAAQRILQRTLAVARGTTTISKVAGELTSHAL